PGAGGIAGPAISTRWSSPSASSSSYNASSPRVYRSRRRPCLTILPDALRPEAGTRAVPATFRIDDPPDDRSGTCRIRHPSSVGKLIPVPLIPHAGRLDGHDDQGTPPGTRAGSPHHPPGAGTRPH